ncbi:MAG TPA: hypothetical protein DEB66_03300 [Micrococcaceae bacterium]|nr:hypothetical protein [Micrococcaceae bacterium]
MKTVRQFGWLVPLIIFGALAIITPVNPWVLGALALATVGVIHFVAIQIDRKRSGSITSK